MTAAAQPSPTYEIRYIHGPDVAAAWRDVHGMVATACDETLTARDVYERVEAGDGVLWVVVDGDGEPVAVASTCVHEKGGHRWLDVMTIGGSDWAGWATELNAAFESYARNHECDAITAHVRRGLERWLARLGWRVRQVHMEYRIDGEE